MHPNEYGGTPLMRVSRSINWARRCLYAMQGLTEFLRSTQRISDATYAKIWLALDAAIADLEREQDALGIRRRVN